LANYRDAETGQPLSPEQIADAFSTGRLAVDTSTSPIIVRDPNGTRIQIDGKDAATRLGDYLSDGYEIETGDQTADTEMRLEAGSQPFQAAGEALASGATMGLYDVVAGELLGDDYSQRAQIRRESLDGYGTGLEIAGGVVPALATGGTSLGARALAATPAGLLARGTAAVGSSLERAMVARGVGAGSARLAGMLAEGGIDGALGGVGEALSEASLGNAEVTAENLLASGGLGALFGAGAGGLFSGASLAAGKGARAAADRLAKASGNVAERGAREAGGFRYLPDGVIDQIVDKGSKGLGIDRDLLRRGFDDPSIRADLINSEPVKQEINKRLRDDLQGMLDNAVHVRRTFAGDVKRSNLAKDVPNNVASYDGAMQGMQEALSPYLGRLDDMKARGLIKPADYKRLHTDAWHVIDSVNDNIGTLRKGEGNLAKAYETLENLKRSADDMRKKLKGGGGTQAEREGLPILQAEVGQLGDSLRKLLEREDLFGAAGAKQASRNAALHKALQTGTEFRNRLVRGTGESVEPEYWEVEKAIIDGDKADSFINNLLNPNRDYTNDQIKRHLSDMADMYDTVLRNDDVPDELVEQFSKARDGARRTLNTLSEAEQRLGRIGQFEAASKAEQEIGGWTGRLGTVGAMVGGFAAGPVGAAAGGALGGAVGAASRPVAMLRAMARMEAISNRSKGIVSDVRTQAKGAVQRLAKPRGERRLAPTLAKAAARAAIKHDDRDEQRKRARNVERKLLELQRDPMAVADAIAYQTGGMADVAPATSLAIAQQINRAVEFLRSKLPPATSTPNMLQPQLNQSLWDAATVDKFDRYLETISDPRSALGDLERGNLSPESVEVLKAVYPTLYGEMRVAVAEQLAEHGEEMPFDSVIQLSLLMDINGHPSMTPEYQAVLAESRQKHAEKSKQQTVSPSKMKPMTVPKSLTERLSGGLE
jgi:hypothetical protein